MQLIPRKGIFTCARSDFVSALTGGIIRCRRSLLMLSVFGSLPRVPPQKCRFEWPLAERRKTGTGPLEAAGHLFGAGGFVLRGVRSVSAGEVDLVG
jgi:hypothetical protein